MYNGIKDISEIPKHVIDEMCHFFTVYKALEHKTTEVNGTVNAAESKKIVEYTIDKYKKKFN